MTNTNMALFLNIIINSLVIVICVQLIDSVKADNCKTPNGELAECVSIYKCPILLEAIKTEDKTILEFAKDSQCGYDKTPLVCCGNKTSYATNLLPPRTYCGYQHSDDYLTSKNDGPGKSLIDEFPWIAALYYKEEGKPERNLCVGSLINNRYVITTAHCLQTGTGAVISKVRLGEYNIEQNNDCVSNGEFDICSDPISDFGIESYVIHEKYHQRLRLNDIGLIRLNREVQYSDYIRPICLPLPGTPRAKIGDLLYQSGWGTSKIGHAPSKIKKKISATLITNKECAKAYTERIRIAIADSHFCTKYPAEEGEFSCQGDSGAPVMLSNKHQWFQEGIIDFGAACGSEFPDVHVRVDSFMAWILKNIKP